MDSFCKTHLDLKYYTTIHIGGIVEWAFFPIKKESLPQIFSIIQDKLKMEFFILGRGSNVIIKEGQLHMAAILTHRLDQFSVEKDLLITDAGIPMSFLAKESILKYGLTGLEFLYGLPGSVGGGAFMNARVFGSEFKDIVEWVEVYDYQERKFVIVDKSECNYSYKHSLFQDKPYFITRIAFKLSKAKNVQECWDIAQYNREMRIKKQQFQYPSAGSFFKNNYQLGKPSGQILDELDMKGYTHGGAKISENHANFFVNPEGKATYQDMKELMLEVQTKLKNKGIELEPEVQFIPKDVLE